MGSLGLEPLRIHEWPARVDKIRVVTSLPVWISEVGVSSFGAEECRSSASTRVPGWFHVSIGIHCSIRGWMLAPRHLGADSANSAALVSSPSKGTVPPLRREMDDVA